MAASYTRKELCNEEEPIPDLSTLPREDGHRMPDGSIHPIQVGLRMVEEFRLRCKEAVEEDPLRAVAVVYEEELTKIKTQLDDGNLEEFTALCPTLSALSPSLYRYFITSIIVIIIIIINVNLQLEECMHPTHSRVSARYHLRQQVLFYCCEM